MYVRMYLCTAWLIDLIIDFIVSHPVAYPAPYCTFTDFVIFPVLT